MEAIKITEKPHEDEKYEIISGAKIIKSYTTPTHNEIVSEIGSRFRDKIRKEKRSCKVFQESVALYCGEFKAKDKNDFYMPDVMVVCDATEEDIREDGVHKVPVFVCEVLSPSTVLLDFNQKKRTYLEIGVEEYWILDPDNKQVTIHKLEDHYLGELVALDHPVYTMTGNVEIDLRDIIGN